MVMGIYLCGYPMGYVDGYMVMGIWGWEYGDRVYV